MSRGKNQKLKLLYLKQFFEEMTDEDHPATMPDILAYLEKHDVQAEGNVLSVTIPAKTFAVYRF